MTLALRYAVRSDVGLLREGNEDSAYAGPHLLAVADGMGGHAAGEVASAATITTIAPLDAEHPGADLASVLADAVATANLRLQELIISDPATEGMGTTLTAMLWSDGYAALCHIGDSRAYLLRGGRLVQITHDHTLVQSLVDEGKITEDDVATHPHRSLLLRALDGRTIAEPDILAIDTLPGDRFLLCSDGLSGVVTEQTLHQTLGSTRDPDKAALKLIELAIKGGGPDNITCIVADVLDSKASAVPPTWTAMFAGAAANGAPAGLTQPVRQSSPATRAMRLTRTAPQQVLPDEPTTGVWTPNPRDAYTGSFDAFDGSRPDSNGAAFDAGRHQRGPWDGPAADTADQDGLRGRHARPEEYAEDDDEYQRPGRRRWPIVTTSLILLVLLVGAGAYGAWWYNQRQYYVGTQNGYVAIFRGTNQTLAGISLFSLVSRSTLPLSELGTSAQNTIAQTISKGSVSDARTLINELQGQVNACQQQWQKLVAWKSQDDAYQKAVAQHKANPKVKIPASPGMQPSAPDAAECAPAAAFAIPGSALPGQQVGAPATSAPATSTPSAAPTGAKATTSPARTPAPGPTTPRPAKSPQADS